MLTVLSRETGEVAQGVGGTDPDALRDAVWIDLREPTADEIALTEDAVGLLVPTNAEVSEIESSSRLILRGGALYLSLPMISLTDRARTTSVGFVLSSECLITVRFASI